MESRRLRLGDNIDDYCPRERRLANHVVVAIIGDDVKQTRCTTCDTEHPYKNAKVPPRRKKPAAAALQPPAELAVERPRLAPDPDEEAIPAAPVPPPPAFERTPDIHTLFAAIDAAPERTQLFAFGVVMGRMLEPNLQSAVVAPRLAQVYGDGAVADVEPHLKSLRP